MAKSGLKEKANVADGMKDRCDAAKDEEKAALAELEEAEADFLAADDGSKEEADAEKRQRKAWKRALRARLDLDKVAATLKLAKKEVKAAAGFVRAAREDLDAIAEGRREP
jgi:hypothetical protein